jgi:transposase-like protein
MVKQTTLRTARIQAVQAATIAIAQQVRTAARNARKAAAYMLAVQQLAARYGVAAPNTMSVRAYNNPQKYAPSAQRGACAQVHAIAAANNGVRSATLAACAAAGINPATAATQFAKYSKQAKQAAQ